MWTNVLARTFFLSSVKTGALGMLFSEPKHLCFLQGELILISTVYWGAFQPLVAEISITTAPFERMIHAKWDDVIRVSFSRKLIMVLFLLLCNYACWHVQPLMIKLQKTNSQLVILLRIYLEQLQCLIWNIKCFTIFKEDLSTRKYLCVFTKKLWSSPTVCIVKLWRANWVCHSSYTGFN